MCGGLDSAKFEFRSSDRADGRYDNGKLFWQTSRHHGTDRNLLYGSNAAARLQYSQYFVRRCRHGGLHGLDTIFSRRNYRKAVSPVLHQEVIANATRQINAGIDVQGATFVLTPVRLTNDLLLLILAEDPGNYFRNFTRSFLKLGRQLETNRFGHFDNWQLRYA